MVLLYKLKCNAKKNKNIEEIYKMFVDFVNINLIWHYSLQRICKKLAKSSQYKSILYSIYNNFKYQSYLYVEKHRVTIYSTETVLLE